VPTRLPGAPQAKMPQKPASSKPALARVSVLPAEPATSPAAPTPHGRTPGARTSSGRGLSGSRRAVPALALVHVGMPSCSVFAGPSARIRRWTRLRTRRTMAITPASREPTRIAILACSSLSLPGSKARSRISSDPVNPMPPSTATLITSVQARPQPIDPQSCPTRLTRNSRSRTRSVIHDRGHPFVSRVLVTVLPGRASPAVRMASGEPPSEPVGSLGEIPEVAVVRRVVDENRAETAPPGARTSAVRAHHPRRPP
jgi:hypothetical protein